MTAPKDEPVRCPRCQEERLIECVDDVIWFCNVCGKPFTICSKLRDDRALLLGVKSPRLHR